MTQKQYSILLSRLALFIIYFWFGFLKVIALSPASGVVQELFKVTVEPMMNFIHLTPLQPPVFVILFGVFEVIIGILFLVPGKERLAVYLLGAHMLTTMLPLLFLKASVWTHILVPTLEGQYIIKNIALIACAFNIWVNIERKNITDSVTI